MPRSYRFPDRFESGLMPSVTTTLNEPCPEPALKAWAERAIAEWAFENQESWSEDA